MSNRRTDHLPTLDGLRGIAVLLVLWFHLPPESMPRLSSALVRIARPGYFGVDIFFVLSGFLITRILISYKEKSVPLTVFYARRFLRIFPAYYLLLAIMAVVAPDWNLVWGAFYGSNFYYALLDHEPDALHHLWSLSVEEHFYLFWPLLIAWLPARGSRRAILWGMLPLALASSVAFVLLFEPPSRGEMLYQNTLCRMLSLCLGGLMAFYETPLRQNPRARRGVAFAAILFGLGWLALAKEFSGPQAWLVQRLVAASIVSCGVVLFALNTNKDSWYGRVLASAPLRHFGTISYGLYLYHHPIYFYLMPARDGQDFAAWRLAVGVAASYACAWLSFRLWETPFLRLKDRFSPPRPSET